jgi:hypothetical protein
MWLLEGATILSVEINCVKKRCSERIGNFNNENRVDNIEVILDLNLGLMSYVNSDMETNA